MNYLASVPWGYARQTVHPQWWQPQDDPCKRQKCSNDVLSALNNKKQARVFSFYFPSFTTRFRIIVLFFYYRKRIVKRKKKILKIPESICFRFNHKLWNFTLFNYKKISCHIFVHATKSSRRDTWRNFRKFRKMRMWTFRKVIYLNRRVRPLTCRIH